MQYPTVSNIKRSSNHEACTSSEDGFDIYNPDSGNLADISKNYNSKFRSNSCNSKIGSYYNYNLTIGSGRNRFDDNNETDNYNSRCRQDILIFDVYDSGAGSE
ncbi:28903_t:CDS:2, partial [Gigaspora margarita]